jgi:DnaK suppressor protein
MRDELLVGARARAAEAAKLREEGVPDPGDASMVDDMRDLLLRFSENERARVLEIDEALERLHQGTYGVCDVCGEPIGEQRLEVQPFTRYCIECKEDLERGATPVNTLRSRTI